MSMTIQQAIENRERCLAYLIGCGPQATAENVEAVRLSLEALREKEERENPKPLTIEELEQMTGKPVWIAHPRYNAWYILHSYNGPEVYGRCFIFVGKSGSKILLPYVECGKIWSAYHNKPKEAQE